MKNMKKSKEETFKQPLTFEEIQEKTEKYILGTYKRAPIAFYFGQGETLYDTEHREYIDFLSGLAVTSLGHGEADVIQALRDQADRLIHTSNLFYNEEQALLAEALIANSFKGKVFFCNSGTEATEAAFKLARKFGQDAKNGATGILALEDSFHGRSTAAMSITGNPKINQGFGPLIADIKHIPANDIVALENEIEQNGAGICALFLELIQGEGGIVPLDKDFVKAARELTTEHNILLVVDEIQTGLARTGKLFAYEHYDMEPDVMTLAKALGAGVPIGAMITKNEFAEYLSLGQHGSTFGGNHLAARAAYETLKVIIGRDVLKHVNGISEYIFSRLKPLAGSLSIVKDVRGMGLHIGLVLEKPGAELAESCLENGLVLNCTAGNVLRLMPPLTISLEKAAEGIDILIEQLEKFSD